MKINGKITGSVKYEWGSVTPTQFRNELKNDQTVTLSNVTGSYYLWVNYRNKEGKESIIKSPVVLLDNTAPTITFAQNGNLYYSKSENEGTVVNVGESHSNIKSLQYIWSRSNQQVPSDFPNRFSNGQKISKAANSRAFYLWVRACDQAGNCNTAVSNVFAGNLLHPNSIDHNRPRLATCGVFDGNEIPIYNRILESRIANAPTKRQKVAAAVRFLAVEFPYRIVYYMNDVIQQYPTQGHYYQKGLFLNSSNGWGCSIKKVKEFPSLNFYAGNYYPNGFDCSGFVTWAFYNAGVLIGDRYSGTFATLGDSIPIVSANEAQLQVGDVLWKNGHVGIVFEKRSNQILVAEAAGTAGSGGLRVTSYLNFESFRATTPFTNIISMNRYM